MTEQQETVVGPRRLRAVGFGPARDAPGPLGEPAAPSTLPIRLRLVYDQLGSSEKALVHSWAAFVATFAATRTLTHVLRRRDTGNGGAGGIVIRGRHLHHYNL